MDKKGIIYGTGAWNMGDIKEKPATPEAYKSGNTI
jgi:hypothetical protein